MKNLVAKTRKLENPYASWTDQRSGWKYKLLKSWQADNSKQYARWFVDVDGYFHEMGDSYVAEVRGGIYSNGTYATDIVFDTSIWQDLGQFIAWVFGEE